MRTRHTHAYPMGALLGSSGFPRRSRNWRGISTLDQCRRGARVGFLRHKRLATPREVLSAKRIGPFKLQKPRRGNFTASQLQGLLSSYSRPFGQAMFELYLNDDYSQPVRITLTGDVEHDMQEVNHALAEIDRRWRQMTEILCYVYLGIPPHHRHVQMPQGPSPLSPSRLPQYKRGVFPRETFGAQTQEIWDTFANVLEERDEQTRHGPDDGSGEHGAPDTFSGE